MLPHGDLTEQTELTDKTAQTNHEQETDVENTLDIAQAALTVEAAIFASLTPVPLAMLQQAFDLPVSPLFIEKCITYLQEIYRERAIELATSHAGYFFQVKAKHAPVIAQLWPERPIKLSQALLETLSVIAYKQPVTRGDIEYYRGVSVNAAILRQLFERGWIIESGYRDVPGRPALLITTDEFLHAFNLASLADLPTLVVPSQAALEEMTLEKQLNIIEKDTIRPHIIN